MEGNRAISQQQRSELLGKIRDFTKSMVKDISDGRSPTVFIDRLRNYCTEPIDNCLDFPRGNEILSLERKSHAHRLDVLLRVLLIVQQLLQQNKHGSKRDIYYIHPSVFSDEPFLCFC